MIPTRRRRRAASAFAGFASLGTLKWDVRPVAGGGVQDFGPSAIVWTKVAGSTAVYDASTYACPTNTGTSIGVTATTTAASVPGPAQGTFFFLVRPTAATDFYLIRRSETLVEVSGYFNLGVPSYDVRYAANGAPALTGALPPLAARLTLFEIHRDATNHTLLLDGAVVATAVRGTSDGTETVATGLLCNSAGGFPLNGVFARCLAYSGLTDAERAIVRTQLAALAGYVL